MNIRLALVSTVLGSCVVACSAGMPREDEEHAAGASADELRRIDNDEGVGGTTVKDAGITDAGSKDTGAPDSGFKGPLGALPGILVKDMGTWTDTSNCAPKRWDIGLEDGPGLEGRTCAIFNRTTSKGTWSATALFPDAPEPFWSKHCAVTFIPNASCESEQPKDVFALTCREQHATTARSAECAADASKCTGSGAFTSAAYKISKPVEPICVPGVPDGGSPANNVPGCDTCGFVSGGILYLSNPFSFTNIWVSMLQPASFTSAEQVPMTATPNSSFAQPLSAEAMTKLHDGPVYIH